MNMKVKKLSLMIIAITILLTLGISTLSQATPLSEPLYFGIREVKDGENNQPDLGYSIGEPKTNNEQGSAAKIWDIVKYSSSNSDDPTKVNVYCVKSGIGFRDKNKRTQYNEKFDLIKDKSVLATLTESNPIVAELVNGDQYNNLVAILNLLYLPNESTQAEREALLTAAGIHKEAYQYHLTDNDIEAVQQAAIWYFTNYGEDNNKYDKYNENNWLWVTENGTEYKNFEDYPTPHADGEERNAQAVLLYRYLLDTAKANAPKYADNTAVPKNKITLYTQTINSKDKETAEQPLVIVEKIPQEFDLALRKYITEINGIPVTNSRVPAINESTIETGDTATYNHRKNPVTVETGNIVTYNITIYNEGDLAGRATKVVDQLPSGLKYVNGSIQGNFDVEEYNQTNNTLKLKRKTGEEYNKNLPAYTQGNLTSGTGSETIVIKCEVTATPDNKNQKVLTNVAWISEEIDEYGTTIEQGQTDRDSKPSEHPNVNKDNMSQYKGNSQNSSDLANSNNWYKGEQDDDDFEKLVIEPVPEKPFDLKLIKRITELNGEKVPERLKSVDITALADGTSTTATYKMEKDPVSVREGDLVKYTFRVYNEGEIDGYASEITENIPTGLEFLWSEKMDAELDADTTLTTAEKEAIKFNQDIWTIAKVNSQSSKVEEIKTDVLAMYRTKADGTPDTTHAYTENLIKAFDKTKAYSDEANSKNPDYREVSVILKVVKEDGVKDIIRNEAEISEDTDSQGNPVTDRDSDTEKWGKENDNKYYDDGQKWPTYKEDDEDYDNIVLQDFDLALRKFITKIEDKNITTRIPQVTYNEEEDKITYTHPKDPLDVTMGNTVIYTIRIFNEGDIDGYAKEITDDIPNGLEFLPENETNKEYRWIMIDKEGKETEDVSKAVKITTDYLSKENEKEEYGNLLKAFDKTKEITDTETNKNPDYKDVKVAFKVIEPNSSDRILVNSAQISDDSDKEGKPVEDKDSIPAIWNEGEDDQDKEYIKLKEFDLALRKFITNITDKDVDTRIPQVTYNEEEDKITYTHPKDPLDVVTGDVVTYTIRVFNEGEMDGYAKEITDDMPNGLLFLPQDETNIEYRWKMLDEEGKETENVSEAVKITTDYLSKENEKEEYGNLLKAFDKTKEIADTETNKNPDYKDVKVAFKVIEPNSSDKTIINSAQISDDSDKDGNPVVDKDSVPNKWNEGEDDQDKEYVVLKEFDLALRKWVTKAIVIENGKQTVTNTGHTPEMDPEPAVKVDIHRNKVDKVTVKFAYSIRITNEGDIAGYAKEITDYVPQGLKFIAADNKNWKDEGNNVISTRALENTLLQPGEHADVEVILTWINGKDNMGLKTNTAEISEDYNDKGVPDRDSTPDNKKPGEDDIDDAPVLLSTMTGQERIYYTLGFTILLTIAGGVVLIKKFIL